MGVDDLLAEIASIGWRLRYLQQEPRHWAAMLYRGQLSTPRAVGYTATEALANAIEAISSATEFTLTEYIPETKANLRDLVGLDGPAIDPHVFDL